MFFESRSCCYLIQNVPWCQNHRRKTLMMWLQNCMKMRYILIHKYFIAMRASSTTFLSFFMPCYCTLPYFFLWEEQQEGKWKICRRRSVFLSSCVHANWSRMRVNPIRFSPSLKWKSFFLLFGIAREERVANNKKMLNRFQYEYAYWSGSDFNKLHRWQNHTQFMNFIIFFWLL